MDSFASGALLFLGLVAFANYKNGTLPDWLKAKFLNSASPAPRSSSPFDVPTGLVGNGLVGATPGAAIPVSGGGGLGALLAPVVGAITGIFGEQRATHKHGGIDFAAPQGTPVKAARAGVVSFAGPQGAYGNLVMVDHGGGSSTKYAHLSAIDVRLGQNVTAGQTIGKVGSTGRSTGPHLHFELTQDGRAIDPNPYLKGFPGAVSA